MIIHCHYRLCDKHSEQTGTLAHWEQANLTQKSDWECPELLKQFKCPTITEYLNVTITVIRNMRELLKYAFKNHLIRVEIPIKPDIKIAYTNDLNNLENIFIGKERKYINVNYILGIAGL